MKTLKFIAGLITILVFGFAILGGIRSWLIPISTTHENLIGCVTLVPGLNHNNPEKSPVYMLDIPETVNDCHASSTLIRIPMDVFEPGTKVEFPNQK